MLTEILVALAVLCSVGPACLFVLNLRRYVPPRFGHASEEPVAVLIPARDEEDNIGECLEHVLASREVNLEVWVLDDDSADRTTQVVREFMLRDPRVGLLRSGVLPRKWDGKQHACWQLARYTQAPVMLFLDADVRVSPWAVARSLWALRSKDVAVISGYPLQVTAGVLDWLLLPLLHFVLLAYLPMARMQRSTAPWLAAGCGQFMMVDREAYFASGGHAAIRKTQHDGLMLPRLMREHEYHTDLVDLTTLAWVRKYASIGAVWRGFAKHATESTATAKMIVPFTLVLIFGQVIPVILLIGAITVISGHDAGFGGVFAVDDLLGNALCVLGIVAAVVASIVPRLLMMRRFKQSWQSATLHPIAVSILLLVNVYALVRRMVGSPVGYRARSYSNMKG